MSKYAPQAPYPPWPPKYLSPGQPGGEQVLQIHGSGNSCSGSPAGWDLPGGFGWLDPDIGQVCKTTVRANGTVSVDTGNSGNDCAAALNAAYTDPNHNPLFLPIYDGYQSTGNNGSYHIAGFAAFVLTGYRITGGDNQPSLIGLSNGLTQNQAKYCSGSTFCVYGFFTRALLPIGSVLVGGTDMGLVTTQLSG
jgi:hypothetical protein